MSGAEQGRVEDWMKHVAVIREIGEYLRDHVPGCRGEGIKALKNLEILESHLRASHREREPETSQFLRDNLPRDWNYRIFVRGVGGVTVRAMDYEAPATDEYVEEITQVDPRETRDDRDLLAQIRLGLERIASRVDDTPAAREPSSRASYSLLIAAFIEGASWMRHAGKGPMPGLDAVNAAARETAERLRDEVPS